MTGRHDLPSVRWCPVSRRQNFRIDDMHQRPSFIQNLPAHETYENGIIELSISHDYIHWFFMRFVSDTEHKLLTQNGFYLRYDCGPEWTHVFEARSYQRCAAATYQLITWLTKTSESRQQPMPASMAEKPSQAC